MNIWEKFAMKDYCSIVTGGATGLGKAMAEALADMGSHIVLADLDQQRPSKRLRHCARKKGSGYWRSRRMLPRVRMLSVLLKRRSLPSVKLMCW